MSFVEESEKSDSEKEKKSLQSHSFKHSHPESSKNPWDCLTLLCGHIY